MYNVIEVIMNKTKAKISLNTFKAKLNDPNKETVRAFDDIDNFEKGKKTKGKLFKSPEESFKELGI